MRMMRTPLNVLFLTGLLAACTPFQEGGQRIGKNVDESMRAADGPKRLAHMANDEMEAIGIKAKEMFTYYPPAPTGRLPVPERWCYQVWQDILCYDEPVAGWRNKLVAYQGNVVVPAPPVYEAGVFPDKPDHLIVHDTPDALVVHQPPSVVMAQPMPAPEPFGAPTPAPVDLTPVEDIRIAPLPSRTVEPAPVVLESSSCINCPMAEEDMK